MSLLEHAKARMVRTGPACTVGTLIEANPTADISELIEAVRAKTIYASIAGATLRDDLGCDIGDEAVRRHARRVCQCPS